MHRTREYLLVTVVVAAMAVVLATVVAFAVGAALADIVAILLAGLEGGS